MGDGPRISVVIPTLNEADLIRAAIESVADGAGEVIVADGGSSDRTVAAASSAGARVISARRGRAAQMKAGARAATGDWLVFLHADTRLDPGWDEALLALDARYVGGAFRFGLDSPRARYRSVEAAVRLRCALFGLPYGDQAWRTSTWCVPSRKKDARLITRTRDRGSFAIVEPGADRADVAASACCAPGCC